MAVCSVNAVDSGSLTIDDTTGDAAVKFILSDEMMILLVLPFVALDAVLGRTNSSAGTKFPPSSPNAWKIVRIIVVFRLIYRCCYIYIYIKVVLGIAMFLVAMSSYLQPLHHCP
jgi:hypothetical protein